MSIRYIVAEISRLFAISSQYPAETIGRQIVWVWFMALACLTVSIGACLPRQLAVEKGDTHDELEGNVEVDERTALLR
jgi:hypothetical protein